MDNEKQDFRENNQVTPGEEQEEKNLSDTIYAIGNNEGQKGTEVIDSFLSKTSREERVAARYDPKNHPKETKNSTKKIAAKSVLFGVDNWDTVLEILSGGLLLSTYEFCRRGAYIEAALLLIGTIMSGIAKKRAEEGPITKAIKSANPRQAIKTAMVDLATTIRGKR